MNKLLNGFFYEVYVSTSDDDTFTRKIGGGTGGLNEI